MNMTTLDRQNKDLLSRIKRLTDSMPSPEITRDNLALGKEGADRSHKEAVSKLLHVEKDEEIRRLREKLEEMDKEHDAEMKEKEFLFRKHIEILSKESKKSGVYVTTVSSNYHVKTEAVKPTGKSNVSTFVSYTER